MKRPLVAAVISVGLLHASLIAPAFAQDKPKPDPPAPGTPVPQTPPKNAPSTPPSPPAAPKPPEKDKDITEYLKDGYEKVDGAFTLYRKKKAAADTLLLEVTADQLKRLYLVQATASTGLSGTRIGVFQGQPLDDLPFTMKIVDDSRILFVEPNLDLRAPGDPASERTLRRGIPDVILASFDIKARQPERNAYLIDLTTWLKSDIGEFSTALGQGPGSYGIDAPFTYLDSVKNLPENLVVRTGYRLNRLGPTGGPRSLPFFVSYNLSVLPSTDYVPRIGDARIGYFETAFRDISDPAVYDQNVNYIKRWNVKKADPNAALSPPVKPIKWYLDNGIPEKYRDAVRRGILLHNKSFEAIGIKDAIVVEQMPDNADWDIADVRYNIVRWTQGNPFAIALFRANPLTGEILNSAINMDAVFATGGSSEFDVFVNPRKMSAKEMWQHPFNAAANTFSSDDNAAKAIFPDLRRHNNDFACSLPYDSIPDMQFGATALSLLEPEGTFDKEAYINQRIVQVVSHEMGHCLGLRHNFVASTAYTMAQLSDPNFVRENGVSASVMDYLPFNVAALNKRGVDFYSQTVGPYDKHAIAYGYTDFGAKAATDELPKLKEIAAQDNLPGFEYQGDGPADAFDPRISRFDLAANPLDYAEKKAQVSDALLRTLDKRLPKNGESYYEFTRQFFGLLNSSLNALSYAPRFIGGINISSNYKGDPGERLPFVPVSGDQQKRALSILNRFVFAPTAFNYPKTNYLKFQPNPNNLGAEVPAGQREYPIYDTISNFQKSTLASVFAPDVQNRIKNNEFRSSVPEQTLTLATLYRSVGNTVWSELGTGQEISGLRRDLQRFHLDILIDTALGRVPAMPNDGVTLSWDSLRMLKAQITAALPKATGEYGKAHLTEALQRINRAFTAQTLTSN